MSMQPLHILLLNQYFPPDTAATAKMATLVTDALAKRHQVTVLAGRPSYDPTERHGPYLLRREVCDNIVVERVGSTTFSRHRMRGRLSNYFSYLALALPRALFLRADVILAMTDPPLAGLVGALVARLRHLPFIYNIRDLHPDMALASGIVRPAHWVDRWEQLHRWVLRQADCIIVLGEDMKQRVIAKGIEPSKVMVVRDGAPIAETHPTTDHPVAREIRCGFPFVVTHAGNLGFYGAWETVIQAAKLLDGAGVGFVFIGDGAAKSQIEALADGCRRVQFLPFRPPEEVPYVLAAGDLHVVTIRRGVEGMVVPSKLYPILAAGRPVLAVVPETSDVARIVTQSGCGVVADPDDPHAVATAIRELFGDHNRLEQMAHHARAAALEYECQEQLERFVWTVEQVATSRRSWEGVKNVWQNRHVLVTGGASFIGSHLVDALVDRGARVRVVDDLSSGKVENIEGHVTTGRIDFVLADLREPGVARQVMQDIDVVFHLAADHGGRGHIDLRQAGPPSSLFLDGIVFWEAVKARVDKVVFASSGWVYPNFLQRDHEEEIRLTEDMVISPYDADNIYGRAKLMGELTLKAYHREHGLKAASCRYFTVYGPRGIEDHAVIAMIARAFVGQDPFEVSGDGSQICNWTYVDDIVRGTILAAEKIDDGTAINLGTGERIRVIEAARMVLDYTGHRAKIKLRPDMPTGSLNRVADCSLAKRLLDWEPQVPFRRGLQRTIDWYFSTKDREQVKEILDRMLTERTLAGSRDALETARIRRYGHGVAQSESERPAARLASAS